MTIEEATLAGGCFWCLEAVYEQVRGVERVTSGYTGGSVDNPSYQLVCSGTTGHAEAVRLAYDAEVVSFAELVELFFTMHDPTTLNRQGGDVGTQYRSAVFFHDDAQRTVAEEIIAKLGAQGVWAQPIVTEVVPLTNFFDAEDYHKEYFRRNRDLPYCQVVIEPKIAKLRMEHLEALKA